MSAWVGGLAEWEEGDTTFLSVAFTWKLDEAHTRAQFALALGRRVVAGGPALFLVQMKHRLADVAEIQTVSADAIARHNPDATMASRGCPVGWKCPECGRINAPATPWCDHNITVTYGFTPPTAEEAGPNDR